MINSALRLKLLDIKERYKEQIENVMDFTDNVIELISNRRNEVYKELKVDLTSEEKKMIENFNKMQTSIDKLNDQLWQYLNMVAVNLIILFEAFNKVNAG